MIQRLIGAIERLTRRVQHMHGIGRTTTPADDSKGLQSVQISINELTLRDRHLVMEMFGFSGCLPTGSDVMIACIGGDPSNGMVIASSHQTLRPKNKLPGEAVMWDGFGRTLKWDKTGGLVINCNTAPITINGATTIDIHSTGGITLDDNVTITKQLTVKQDIIVGPDALSVLQHFHPTGAGDTGTMLS